MDPISEHWELFMKTYDPSKPLISIHIPKCGGSSLGALLEKGYGDNYHSHYFNEKTKEPPIRLPLVAGLCIHGHFNTKRGFGIKQFYPEVDQFVTIVRDPFDILVSRYYYVKSLERKNAAFWAGEKLTFENDINEFLSKQITKQQYIPNIFDYLPFDGFESGYQQEIEKKFIYIGLFEDFSYSVRQIAQRLGFPFNRLEHRNKGALKAPIDDRLRKKFIDIHQIEYNFYNLVRSNYKRW
jgi:hypothetical protein